MTHAASRRPFNSRAFLSIGMVLAAAALPLSGLANHLLQFEPMSVARHAWMSLHTSLGVVFVAFVAGHIVVNRRALAGHLRGIVTGAPAVRREILYALLVVFGTSVIVVSHAFHVHGLSDLH